MRVKINPDRRPNEYRLTEPQARALRVLGWAEQVGANVTESNHTTKPGTAEDGRCTVYWQVRAWLSRQQFITTTFRGGRTYLHLTKLGYEVAHAVAKAQARDSRPARGVIQ
jgi:hypothetical protein